MSARLLLVALLVASVLAYPQTATTTLTGTVMDQSGAAVPNASVRVVDPATGVTRKTTSDNRGSYQFQQLAPGTYDVIADAKGFSAETL